MKNQTIFTILISFIVLVIVNSPLLYSYLNPEKDMVFLGRRYVNVEDTYTYVSFIESAKQGKLLFENLYTSEEQKNSLFRPSYLAIGTVAKLVNIPSIAAYHLFRIIFSIVFFVTLYKFLQLFFKEKTLLTTAYAITLTSSGIGYLVPHSLRPGIDLWMPEAFTFFSLFEAPHFILSQILTFAGLIFYIKFIKERDWQDISISYLLFLMLSFEHPFNLVVIAPVLTITAIWSGVGIFQSLSLGFFSSIGLFYQLYATFTNPIMKAWQDQNLLFSPAPVTYFFGYIFLIIFGIIGLEQLLQDKLNVQFKLILTWIIIVSLFVYLPFNFQRRLVEGIHVPLSIFAAYGIFYLADKYFKRSKNSFIGILVLVMYISSLFIVYQDFKAFRQDRADNYFYHISKVEIQSLEWLKEHSDQNDVILSNSFFGNLIPGITGKRVFLGHPVQTIKYEEKGKRVDAFLTSSSEVFQKEFLDANNISYIYLGVNDNLLKSGFKPELLKFLELVYNEGGVQIYKVQH